MDEATDDKKGSRTMPIVLLREVTDLEQLKKDLADGVEVPLMEVMADESDKLMDQDAVTAWLEKKGFEGEVFVAVFRKGTGKQAGKYDRMRRRRFKPDSFVVE